MMDPEILYNRYLELRRYVDWSDDDTARVQTVGRVLRAHIPKLVDDFYLEIEKHPHARKVITGGSQQVERLKGTLANWLRELLAGTYNADYVVRRWKVGYRHVDIGLEQVYTNVAITRLKTGMLLALEEEWQAGNLASPKADPLELMACIRSLNKLLDLDMAIIGDAYQTEFSARQQQSERLATIGQVAGGIVTIDQNGMIEALNPAAEKMFGYTDQRAIGKDFNVLLANTETDAARIEFTPASPSGSDGAFPIRREVIGRKCEGSTFPLDLSINNVPLDDRNIFMAFVHDVTELRVAQQQLLQSERLAAVGKAIAGLAHESRNALQRSQACLEMLARRIDDRPEAVDLLNRVQRAQNDLGQLYEEVREYAAPVRLKPANCSLDEILQDAWEQLQVQRKGRKAELHNHPEELAVQCEVDHFALSQVLRNILENSLAACDDPVRIEAEFSSVHLNGRPAVRLEIRDNGPGLSPDDLQHIFDEFYTTKTHGTGLGMAIVKRLIDAHGGTVEVRSDIDRGAGIVITLPRTQP